MFVTKSTGLPFDMASLAGEGSCFADHRQEWSLRRLRQAIKAAVIHDISQPAEPRVHSLISLSI